MMGFKLHQATDSFVQYFVRFFVINSFGKLMFLQLRRRAVSAYERGYFVQILGFHL